MTRFAPLAIAAALLTGGCTLDELVSERTYCEDFAYATGDAARAEFLGLPFDLDAASQPIFAKRRDMPKAERDVMDDRVRAMGSSMSSNMAAYRQMANTDGGSVAAAAMTQDALAFCKGN